MNQEQPVRQFRLGRTTSAADARAIRRQTRQDGANSKPTGAGSRNRSLRGHPHQKPDAIIIEERASTVYLAKETLERILRDYRLVSVSRSENSNDDPLLQFYVRQPSSR
jgi:hypothetical protein